MITGKKSCRSQCDLHIHGKHDSQIQYDRKQIRKHLRQLPAHKKLRITSTSEVHLWE